MNESHCKSCGTKVVFLKDENGKTQILDLVAPVYTVFTWLPDPTTILHRTERCHRAEMSYVSHFATCPNASKHSKKE